MYFYPFSVYLREWLELAKIGRPGSGLRMHKDVSSSRCNKEHIYEMLIMMIFNIAFRTCIKNCEVWVHYDIEGAEEKDKQ